MWIHTDRHGDVVDLVVGEQPVALDLPGVEHLAAQRQDGLAFLVAAHLGAAAGRVALDQKHFVVGDVAAFAIGQLAWQHRHARPLALLHLLARLLAALGGLDGQLGQLLAVVHVLIEPQLQRRTHITAHQPHGIARIQALLDLALELGIQHLGAQHIRSPRKHVFRQQLDALGQQGMQLDKTLDRLEQAVAQTAFVRAARAGGDEVHITLAHRLTVFGEGHTPGCALAFGKAVVPAVGKPFALKEGNHRVGVQCLLQIVAQAALVLPDLGVFGFLVHQRDAHAGHQHRLAAQQVRQLVHGQGCGLEVFAVWPGAYRRALLAVAVALGLGHQRLHHIARSKCQARHLALPVTRHLEPGGQRVGHTHTHAVQATREAVGAAFALVELATGVQAGEDQLHHRGLFFGVHAKRDAATIVFDTDRLIGVQRHLDLFAVPRQRFVRGVVQHLLDDVQRIIGPGVHPRTLFDRFESLEDANRTFGVFRVALGRHGGGL